MNSYRAGVFSEFLARWYLRLRGFRIVAWRYRTGAQTGRAEIDIIARRGNLMIFVEVKSRPSVSAGLCAITAPQALRLRRAAETYLARRRWTGDARFDAIVVCGRKIKWIQGVI